MKERVLPATVPPPLVTLQVLPSRQTCTGIPKLRLYPFSLHCPAFLAMIPTFKPRMSRTRRQTKRRLPDRCSTFQLHEQKTKREGPSCQIQPAKVVRRRRRLYTLKLGCSKTQLEDYVKTPDLLGTHIRSHAFSVSWRLGNSFLPTDRPDDGGVRSRTIAIYHRP